MKTEEVEPLEILSRAAARAERAEPKSTLTRSETDQSQLTMDVDLFDFVELGLEYILTPPSIVRVVLVKLDGTNTW